MRLEIKKLNFNKIDELHILITLNYTKHYYSL